MKRYPDIISAAKDYGHAWGFIFDMDGLLFDTERLFMEQLALAMAEEGYRLTREVYCRSLGLGGRELEQLMLSEYGRDYPFAEMGRRTRERVDIIADTVGLVLKPGIVELLEWLRGQGICCAVASSTNSSSVKKYLQRTGILSYFSAVVGGDMVEHSKPEPDIFLLACDLCGLKPDQAVVLEDSENGVRAAVAAGIPVICVPDLKEPGSEVCQLANAIISPNAKNAKNEDSLRR